MRCTIVLLFLVGGCTYGSAALHAEQVADERARLGQGLAAEDAARRAAALREAARAQARKPHGWLWHDLAMD